MNIPEGFSSVTPYLFVRDADAYVRFLRAAFGARELGRSHSPDGCIANCQVRLKDATLMLSQATPDYPPSVAAFCHFVADADAAVTRALKAGAEHVMDVADMPYGDRQGGVRDPEGNLWWLSQRLLDRPYF